MKIYLDTSSLFKLYHQEADSHIIESIFTEYSVMTVFLSELVKVEFSSALWKKVRTKDISEQQANAILQLFEADHSKYKFIPIDNLVIEHASNLISKYGREGLRALDSIQLSTSVLLKDQADLFITADQLLLSLFQKEGLQTEMAG